MATGIVSLALNGAGWLLLARGLFSLNVAVYTILGILLAIRAVRYRAHLAADFGSHVRAPGFFTLVAAPACSATSVCCSSAQPPPGSPCGSSGCCSGSPSLT